MRLWHPAGQPLPQHAVAMANLLTSTSPPDALAQWQPAWPEAQAAHVHGTRHDLWWEFALSASFRWQAHLHRLNPAFAAERLNKLTRLFKLDSLLEVRVEDLSLAEQARADLAVKLLTQPDLLVWTEPFAALHGLDRLQVSRAVWHLCQAEGLTVITTARKEGLRHERKHTAWVGGVDRRASARSAG